MTLVYRIAKNTAFIILGSFIAKAINLAVSFLLARYLKPSGFGTYSYIFAYLGFFGIISDMGIREILVREIARRPERTDELIGVGMILRVFLSLVAIILASSIVVVINNSLEVKQLIWLASLGMLFSFSALYKVVFQVKLKWEFVTLCDTLDGLIKLSVFLFLIVKKAPLSYFIVAIVLMSMASWGIIAFFSRNFVKPKWKISFPLWKELLKNSWPLAITTFFIIIYNRIDQVMLFQMKGDKEVGLYSAAVRLVEGLNIIPFAFIGSVYPVMSRFFKSEQDSFEKTVFLSFRYLMTVMVPLATLLFIITTPLIHLIYGKDYAGSGGAFLVLVWSAVWVCFVAITHYILNATNKQNLNFYLTGTTAGMNVLLNFLLIPSFGIVGASIATLISYGTGPLVGGFLPATRYYFRKGFRSITRPFIASLLSGFISWKLFGENFYAVIPFVVIYCVLIWIIGGINREDLIIWKKVFNRE